MPPTVQEVEAGIAVYTPGMLSIYDYFVLGFSNRFLWKCPTPRILAHYNEHISDNHLDVGVGTGYFLDHCRFSTATPRVALMDMNANSLAFTSKRIARYRPEVHRHNVLERISAPIEPFDSIGVNYLLHCLPGTMHEKGIVFEHLSEVMRPGGRIFGATILSEGIRASWPAKKLMVYYNRRGIFSNSRDSVESLREALARRFRDVSIVLVGCVALFAASRGGE